jgi:hypothetical protein
VGAQNDASTLQAELESSGLDVDGLLARRVEIMELRRLAATGVNKDLIGETVRIPGFVVPVEFRDLKAVEFLLVPTAGACIHTPPPPANQIVHVHYPEGIEIKTLYDPVWVSGQIAAESAVQAVRYVDGTAPVEASYVMQAVLVAPYRQKTAPRFRARLSCFPRPRGDLMQHGRSSLGRVESPRCASIQYGGGSGSTKTGRT